MVHLDGKGNGTLATETEDMLLERDNWMTCQK